MNKLQLKTTQTPKSIVPFKTDTIATSIRSQGNIYFGDPGKMLIEIVLEMRLFSVSNDLFLVLSDGYVIVFIL